MAKISEERREERRRQILKAAVACFARKGFHATRVQDICREAALSPGAIYVYFNGKDAIVRALAEEAQAASETLWADAEQAGDASGLDRIEKLFDRVCSQSDPTAARMGVQFWAQAFDNAFLSDAMQADHKKSVVQVTRLLRSESALSRAEAKTLAEMIVAALRGFGLQKAIVPTIDLKPAARAFMRGLRNELGAAVAVKKPPKKRSDKKSKVSSKRSVRGNGGRKS